MGFFVGSYYYLFVFVFLQERYQHEVDRLTQENKNLRKEILLLKGEPVVSSRKIKVNMPGVKELFFVEVTVAL